MVLQPMQGPSGRGAGGFILRLVGYMRVCIVGWVVVDALMGQSFNIEVLESCVRDTDAKQQQI